MTYTAIEWAAEAACVGKTEMFFQDTMKTVVNKAKKICNSCGAKDECLQYALENNERGVWGATTERERRQLRAQMATVG
jgi:WhiB family redox-sensing transcriptional regulator